MADKEYEILPHEELQKLREEVEELKRNPMQNIQESEDLKSAMGKLTRAMHHLIEIFTRTNDEMVSEFKRTSISEHFQKISDQNEKIAQALLGMVALQDPEPPQQPTQAPLETQDNVPGMMQTSTPPPLGVDQPLDNPTATTTPPPIETPEKPPEDSNALNLPPPEHHKRKGLSGLFHK